MSDGSVTIKDIAKMLGISKSTVSRALSEHSDVNPETRQKVVEVAQRLHYQPNTVAVNLKQQRTNTIGVIIPETTNHFFAKAIGGIQHVANLNGYNVVICQSDESYVAEKNNLRSLLAARVDGLLISVSEETDRTDHFETLFQKKLPTVFFDRVLSELDSTQVTTDNFEIGIEGTEHLISQGCKRIALIAGPQNLENSKWRLHGYLKALQKHNLPSKETHIIYSHFNRGSVEEYTRYLINLPQRPDGIFCINDYAAVEMMHIIKKYGLQVPKDIAVLGFNNDHVSKFVDPPLSSIELSPYDMGSVSAEILLEHIKNPNYPIQKRLIKSTLIVRGSTHRKPYL